MDNQTINPKQTLLEKLQSSTNILVTVSSNPSVDQLAACLGLTIWLNKMDKHATAVFSGEVPSTLEFLQPAETLEKNTDSLRDFIISLDKSKADKLRYKVEDTVVKVFVTPYRTSLSAEDLEFSQGDFNVDMVVALGVSSQEDIDTAITAHGRILHDATVATITSGTPSELGSINWNDSQASSLSELIVELGNGLSKEKLDNQISTALLTGIVAETDRFSNEKTTPQTMSVSAELMSAGADQQLVASKLEEPVAPPPAPEPEPVAEPEAAEAPLEITPESVLNDGTLAIDHQYDEPKEAEPTEEFELPQPVEDAPVLPPEDEPEEEATPEPTADESDNTRGNRMITEPPTLGGTLTANAQPEDIMLEQSSDPLTSTAVPAPLFDRPEQSENSAEPEQSEQAEEPAEPEQAEQTAPTEPQPAPPSWMPPQPWMDQLAPTPAEEPESEPEQPDTNNTETLEDIERSVASPHITDDLSDQPDLSDARDEVMKAINGAPDPRLEPIQALNAQPVDLTGGTSDDQTAEQTTEEPQFVPAPQPEQPIDPMAFDPSQFATVSDVPTLPSTDEMASIDPNEPVSPDLTGPVEQMATMPLPDTLMPQANPVPPTSVDDDPTAPPPVPPPLMPPGFPQS